MNRKKRRAAAQTPEGPKAQEVSVKPEQIRKIQELQGRLNGAQAELNAYLTGVLDGHEGLAGRRVVAMNAEKNTLTVVE